MAEVSGGAPPYVYVWSFGDGSSPGFGQSLEHTFPGCGFFSVAVVVVGWMGAASNSTSVGLC